MKAFRFILIINGTSYEVDPIGVDGAKLKSEPEGENVFFRRKLSGSLKFVKSDFALLYALETSEERCADVFLNLEMLCDGAWRLEWQGVFSLNEVKFNVSKCEATVQARPNDAYRCVIDHYNKEYNILEVPVSEAIAANVGTSGTFEFLQILHEDLDDLEDRDSWGTFLEMRYWIDGSGADKGYYSTRDILFRQVLVSPYVNGEPEDLSQDGWFIVAPNDASQMTTYGRPPEIPGFTPFVYRYKSEFYGKYPDLLQWNCGDLPDPAKYVVVRVDSGTPDCVNIPTKRFEDRYVTLIWEFGSFYFTRNRNFLDTLRFLVQKTCPAVAPQFSSQLSEFFSGNINYATGATNKLKGLLLAQKTDIINYKSSEAATKGIISLKKVLDDLAAMFDVHWFINAAGKFQLEHISYFENVGFIDFTVEKYKRNLAGKFEYEYETAKMPRYEKLTFTEAAGDDFKEGVIEYQGACVNYEEGQDIKEKSVSNFVTDLNLLVVSGESVAKNGFVLMAQSNGQIDYEVGDLTGSLLTNGHLSAANLLKNYHKHNRVLSTGLRNGKPAIFASVLKTKKQVSFSVDYSCELEINPFFRYITNVSENGSLAASELNLKTGTVTIETIHETYGSGFNVSGRQFDDSFDDSFK